MQPQYPNYTGNNYGNWRPNSVNAQTSAPQRFYPQQQAQSMGFQPPATLQQLEMQKQLAAMHTKVEQFHSKLSKTEQKTHKQDRSPRRRRKRSDSRNHSADSTTSRNSHSKKKYKTERHPPLVKLNS